MQRLNGRAVYSATDLVGFLACEHLTNLERAAIAGLVERPARIDPELDRIARRGEQHERRFLTELAEQGLSVVEIAADRSAGTHYEQLVQAAAKTVEAMRNGVDVIYQDAFFDGQWLGHADFLRKVDSPSALGPWSYEVWDTKLARSTKGSAIIQICFYTDMASALQGAQPERMHLALADSAREVQPHRFADYAAYYRLMRAEFLSAVGGADASYPPPTLPDPVEHCEVCRWSLVCRDARRRTDDLSLVAGIAARQRKLLRERRVGTRRALAALPLPLTFEPAIKPSQRPSLDTSAVDRIQREAPDQLRKEPPQRALGVKQVESYQRSVDREGGTSLAVRRTGRSPRPCPPG